MNLNGLKNLLKTWSRRGLYLPMAWDEDKKGPSVTLLAFYIGLSIGAASVVALHFVSGLLTATSMALLFCAMTFVFYKLRRLEKVKVDFDDKEIELDANSGDEEERKEEKNEPTAETNGDSEGTGTQGD